MPELSLPLLGICAFSGTGKTTLLIRMIPLLRARGIRVAMIKHAHHSFEMDYPGKDSYELRKAGATQMLVVSRQRLAMIQEYAASRAEPALDEAIAALNPADADLVLVEGFKRESFPKVELHRPSLGKPLMCGRDPNIIAVASDAPLQLPRAVPLLDLNRPAQIAEFVLHWSGLADRAVSEEATPWAAPVSEPDPAAPTPATRRR